MTQESQVIQQNIAHSEHPSPGTYFKVAITLAIITAVEIAVFYLEFVGHGIIPILALLSGAKFILVMMYYMHLKFDSRIFSTLFVAGLVTAAGILFALMTLFRFFA
ncbi:MAG: cytochrome C oxidase subunit IV family protein [Chloroflexi bacterium]|nr:cytochrome C oxidase subunit IV family protein [Chloroflexota bacterium]